MNLCSLMIISCLASSVPAFGVEAVTTTPPPKQALMPEVNRLYQQFEEKVTGEKATKKRVEALSSLLNSLEKLKENPPEATIDGNVYYEQLVKGIKLIPQNQKYTIKSCEVARVNILSTLEPKIDFDSKRPVTTRVLNILRLVGPCVLN